MLPMNLGGQGQDRSDQHILLIKNQWKLALEVCHFTSEYNPHWPASSTQKQICHLMAEAKAFCPTPANDRKTLQNLIQFFFYHKGFDPVPANSLTLPEFFLPYVTHSRKGPTELLMLLFTTLAENLGLKTQVISCKKYFLLKICLDNKPCILDFTKKGQILDPYEIVSLINAGIEFSKTKYDNNKIVIRYLQQVKRIAKKNFELPLLSLTHSYLMRYQPFNLKHLSERAIAAYQTGDYRSAVDDIRSYFLYKSPEVTNTHLKRIYKLARRLESR